MLITRAALLDGRRVDVRVEDTITAVAERLRPRAGEDVLDGAGGLLIPGLHDHHVHLRAAVAASASVRVGLAQVRDREQLGQLLKAATPGADGWIRAVGYHDRVAGALDSAALDELRADVPVRVQHRSGALWILNSAGLARIDRSDHPDGRFHRAIEVLDLPGRVPEPAGLSRRLLSHGVTGLTDATPGQGRASLEQLAAATRSGAIVQRLHCMAPAATTPIAGITLGPAKLILDDVDLDLDRITDWIADNHRHHHPVAVHCVTVAQLVVTMAALRDAGVHRGDRIEHAAMVPDDCLGDLAALGITVVTQPNFVAERGDEYLAEVPADERGQLWRLAALRSAGIRVALSTDMPFGDPDPWRVMAAAADRRARSGRLLGADERIPVLAALQLFTGRPEDPGALRTVATGQPADLCLLSGTPAEVLADPDSGRVRASVVAGEIVWQR